MIDKMHSELSYYQKNKEKFKDIDTYFEKLYCNLFNLYQNNLKGFYEMIKENSRTETQIIEIINQTIMHYVGKEKYEDCHQLLLIRKNIAENLNLIFE